MIVINRFRTTAADEATQSALHGALAVLARQRGFVEGHVGRCVDDAGLWLLQTRWENVGSYRRALSAYDVKMEAWSVLGQAVEEPSAYEIVAPGERPNRAEPRQNP